MMGIERQFRKGVEAMDEKVEIKKQDFYELMYLMEKILYIAERAGAREDSDNNAYSLAITFGKENVVQELLSLRRKMNHYALSIGLVWTTVKIFQYESVK